MNWANVGKITAIVLLSAALGVGGVLLFQTVRRTMEEEAVEQVDDRAFLTTHQTITDMYNLGINVDTLIEQYAVSCLSVNDFSAAVSLFSMFSDAKCADTAYFEQIFTTIINSGGGKSLPKIMEAMRGRNASLDSLFDSFYKDYGAYLQ